MKDSGGVHEYKRIVRMRGRKRKERCWNKEEEERRGCRGKKKRMIRR